MYRLRDFGVTLCALLLIPAGAGEEKAWPAAVSNAGMVRDSASGEVLLYGGTRDRETHNAVFSTTGAFFALSVPDLEASVSWYSEKLGLRVIMRPPPEERTQVAVLEGNGLIVELLQLADARPLSRVAPNVTADYLVHGYFKAGLVVDDFDHTMEMLRTRGVEIAMGPFPARPGQRANVIVRDNAGNLIQFFGR